MNMNTKGLVSIITPCYNGEKYVHRLLDSILIQDYPLIEMFVIDDGSTDNTKNIIEAYIPKFQNKGYSLSYIYQENAGQASALNRGLKLIKGEFLIWPDSDDYYCSDKAISTFVETFRNLDNSYGMVRCQGYNVDEETLDVISERNHHIHSEQLFEAYFYGKENIGGSGLFMIRMVAFDNVVKNRDIYDKRHPQNIQMVLPVVYSYKTYTILDHLHNIAFRVDSHSHKKKDFEEILDDTQGFLDIFTATIMRMPKICHKERIKYISSITRKIQNIQMTFCIRNEKFEKSLNIYMQMKRNNVEVSFKNKILHILIQRVPSFAIWIVRHF